MVWVLSRLSCAGAAPTSWAAAALAAAGTAAAPRAAVPESVASGNRTPGAWPVTAAYRAGLTNTAVSSCPLAGSAAAVITPVAVEATPGMAAIWRSSDGGIT